MLKYEKYKDIQLNYSMLTMKTFLCFFIYSNFPTLSIGYWLIKDSSNPKPGSKDVFQLISFPSVVIIDMAQLVTRSIGLEETAEVHFNGTLVKRHSWSECK